MEALFAYAVLLSVRLVSMEQYNGWLDDAFQKTTEKDGILMELEFCSNDIDRTINLIDSFINPYLDKLDYSLTGRILFKALENEYHQKFCDLEDLAHKAYNIWNMLPSNIENEEPFFTLCYIDDPLSYRDEKRTRELFHKLFDYYKEVTT